MHPVAGMPPIAVVLSIIVCLAVLVIPFMMRPKAISAAGGAWQALAQTYAVREPFAGQMKEATKAIIGSSTFGGANEPKLMVHASDDGLRLSYAGSTSEWNKFEYPDVLIPWKKFTYYNATSTNVSLILGDPSVRMDIAAPGLDTEVTRFMNMYK